MEEPVGGYEVWYDASSNPNGAVLCCDGPDPALRAIWNGYQPAPTLPDQLDGSTEEPIALAPTSCPNLANWWCSAPPAGVRRVWFTGDGALVEVPDDGSTVSHRYGLSGTYRSLLVEYGDTGAVLRQQWFTMDIV